MSAIRNLPLFTCLSFAFASGAEAAGEPLAETAIDARRVHAHAAARIETLPGLAGRLRLHTEGETLVLE